MKKLEDDKNDLIAAIASGFLSALRTPCKSYPPDGNGALAWIEDMSIAVREMRNKRTNFVPWEEQRNFIKNAFKLNAHMIRREGE